MTIENAMDAYIRADTVFMAYLGGSTAPTLTTGRLYWMQAPQGATLPYVVYTMVDDTDFPEWFNKTNTGQGRIQFDVVSDQKSGKAIADALRTKVRGQSGTLGGLAIYAIYPINRREKYNPDTLRYVWTMDYEVHAEY